VLGNPLHVLYRLKSTLLRAEDRRSGNNDLGPGGENILQIARTDTPIDFNPGWIPIGYDNFSELSHFF
jgi:hypothetical protein